MDAELSLPFPKKLEFGLHRNVCPVAVISLSLFSTKVQLDVWA